MYGNNPGRITYQERFILFIYLFIFTWAYRESVGTSHVINKER